MRCRRSTARAEEAHAGPRLGPGQSWQQEIERLTNEMKVAAYELLEFEHAA